MEKALLADEGISPEDVAKIFLIQGALAEKGVLPDSLIEAILALIDEADYSKAGESALAALKLGNISQEEIIRMLAASKALGAGAGGVKVRGWKQIKEILADADLTSPQG